ncbi:hypothetical protein BH18ACT11_BH18ACT11_13560 [soil metagenome]
MIGRFGLGMNRRTLGAGVLGAILLLVVVVLATGTATSQTATCNSTATLGAAPDGSAFEIDSDANLKVDNANCIDWLTGTNVGDPLRPGVIAKADLASGSGDNSFVQGSKEDTADPVIDSGGIPPNKSDLGWFGLYTEQDPPDPPDGFLELFWSRVQDPSGTTNMDFELNKLFCGAGSPASNCSANGVTPKRSVGDILITYDLSRGGTVATISIRKWTGTQWGPADTLDPTEARGTINTSLITQSPLKTAQNSTGSLDPRTFGEAVVSFEALFGEGGCGEFGSAYLKSRSSDSFTAALKDFVPPTKVNVSNCPAGLTTTASEDITLGQTPAATIHDTAHLDVPDGTTGSITFKLYDSVSDCETATDVKFTSTITSVNGPNDYVSGSFTPLVAGTYVWTATFTPTAGQGVDPAGPTSCTDPAEDVVVKKAESSITSMQNYLPNDTATISGAGTLNGTVTFTLYRTDAQCTADTNNDNGTAVYKESGVALGAGNTASTNNTTYKVEDGAKEGAYTWGVTYSGDNTNNGSRSCVEDSSVTINN